MKEGRNGQYSDREIGWRSATKKWAQVRCGVLKYVMMRVREGHGNCRRVWFVVTLIEDCRGCGEEEVTTGMK